MSASATMSAAAAAAPTRGRPERVDEALDDALSDLCVTAGDAIALVSVVADEIEREHDEGAARRARTLRIAIELLAGARDRVDAASARECTP